MKKTGVRFRFFSVSIFFSLGLALFSLYTVSLLFPLLKGIIESNFDHVKNQKILGDIIKIFPDIFSDSVRIFLLLVVWIYITIILKNILQYATAISVDFQVKQATLKLRNLLLDRYFLFGKGFFDSTKTHVIHSTLIKSSKVIEKQFVLFKNLIVQIFLFIVFLSIMIKISWSLTLVSVIIFPVINFFTRIGIRKVRFFMKESEELEDGLNQKVSNIINCIPLIKSFAREEDEKASFKVISEKEINKNFIVKKVSSLLPSIEDIGATTSMLMLAFGMAFVMHLMGGIDPTSALVFLYVSQRMVPTLNSFNHFSIGMINSKKDVEEINKILIQNEEHIVAEGDDEFVQLREGIEIKNLTFSYHNTKTPTISGLSMYIPKGKLTAIVGPTGSGKSTIVNLLLRFYDVEPDTILVDGVDIRKFNTKHLRRKISFIGQETLLFNDTVLNNLSYGKSENMTNESVFAISKKITVDNFVQKMPKKYNTMIEERGSNLSGGQKQRISIVRALVRAHDILILDEATSSLDAGVENKVIEAITEYSQGKTRIVISHRLSTIKEADNIIFIKNGKVKEAGTLEELLTLKGDFYESWQLQKLY